MIAASHGSVWPVISSTNRTYSTACLSQRSDHICPLQTQSRYLQTYISPQLKYVLLCPILLIRLSSSITAIIDMCKIQNQYACPCLGEVEPAFTPQDVRSCPCPSIVKFYQVRRRCRRCQQPGKKHTRRWTGIGTAIDSKRFETESRSQETNDVNVSRDHGSLQRRASSATTSTSLHPHSVAEKQSIYYTPQSMPCELRSQGHDEAPWTFDVFISSTWNDQFAQGSPRVGRWPICAEADVVNETGFQYDEQDNATRQQLIDKIEVVLGQLAGLHLSGLVMKACKVSLP